MTSKEATKLWRKANPEKVRKSIDRFHKKNPLWRVDQNLRRQHGLSVHDYADILELQGGGCGICGSLTAGRKSRSGKPGRFIFDHNHETREIRGLICHPCNAIIGFAKDSVKRLQAVIDYLEKL